MVFLEYWLLLLFDFSVLKIHLGYVGFRPEKKKQIFRMAGLKFGIIVSSIREGRMADRVIKLIQKQLTAEPCFKF